MLTKLIKYEFKNCARYLVPIYIAMLAVFTINSGLLFASVNNNFSNELITGIMVFASVAVFVALSIASIYVTAKRFAQSVYGDEGYLTNTLPVSAQQIVGSKTIVLTAYYIISTIVVFVSLAILLVPLLLSADAKNLAEASKELSNILALNNISVSKYILTGIVTVILSSVSSTVIVFMCVSIAHLKSFVQHKYLVGILTYVLISIITNIALTPILDKLVEVHTSSLTTYVNPTPAEVFGTFLPFIDNVVLVSNLATVLIAVIGYGVTYYLVKNKLNLE